MGAGIACDFPICVVPMLYQDTGRMPSLFGAIFSRFLMLQLVVVHAMEQYQMRKLFGEN